MTGPARLLLQEKPEDIRAQSELHSPEPWICDDRALSYADHTSGGQSAEETHRGWAGSRRRPLHPAGSPRLPQWTGDTPGDSNLDSNLLLLWRHLEELLGTVQNLRTE